MIILIWNVYRMHIKLWIVYAFHWRVMDLWFVSTTNRAFGSGTKVPWYTVSFILSILNSSFSKILLTCFLENLYGPSSLFSLVLKHFRNSIPSFLRILLISLTYLGLSTGWFIRFLTFFYRHCRSSSGSS